MGINSMPGGKSERPIQERVAEYVRDIRTLGNDLEETQLKLQNVSPGDQSLLEEVDYLKKDIARRTEKLKALGYDEHGFKLG